MRLSLFEIYKSCLQQGAWHRLSANWRHQKLLCVFAHWEPSQVSSVCIQDLYILLFAITCNFLDVLILLVYLCFISAQLCFILKKNIGGIFLHKNTYKFMYNATKCVVTNTECSRQTRQAGQHKEARRNWGCKRK